MKVLPIATAALCVVAFFVHTECRANTVINSDFSKGNFVALGWTVKGDWDEFQYPHEAANNPGRVTRFAANKPAGSISKTFPEIRNPRRLTLSLDYGWGWGDA